MTLSEAIKLLGTGRVVDIDYNNMWNNPGFAFTGRHRIVIFTVGGSFSELRPNGSSGIQDCIRVYDYLPSRSLSGVSGWKLMLLSQIRNFTELNFNITSPPAGYNKNDSGMRRIYAAR